jgi:hypothetical protein
MNLSAFKVLNYSYSSLKEVSLLIRSAFIYIIKLYLRLGFCVNLSAVCILTISHTRHAVLSASYISMVDYKHR